MIDLSQYLNKLLEIFLTTPTPLLVLIGALLLVKPIIMVITKLGFVPRDLLDPKFTTVPLLNNSETRLFALLQELKPMDHHLFSQVSYGEFLRCGVRPGSKFWSINAKRADFVFCNSSFDVTAVVEYQGHGHYGSTKYARENTNKRDKIKRKALAEAGIPMIEIPPKFDNALVERLIKANMQTQPRESQGGMEPTITRNPPRG